MNCVANATSDIITLCKQSMMNREPSRTGEPARAVPLMRRKFYTPGKQAPRGGENVKRLLLMGIVKSEEIITPVSFNGNNNLKGIS